MSETAHYTLNIDSTPDQHQHQPPNMLILFLVIVVVISTGYANRNYREIYADSEILPY